MSKKPVYIVILAIASIVLILLVGCATESAGQEVTPTPTLIPVQQWFPSYEREGTPKPCHPCWLSPTPTPMPTPVATPTPAPVVLPPTGGPP